MKCMINWKYPVCSQQKTVLEQSIKHSYVFCCTMNRSLPTELQKINCRIDNIPVLGQK